MKCSRFVLAAVTAISLWSSMNVVAATKKQVLVPGEDRFSPFELKIKVGDTVMWQNQDTDDHTIVSLDVTNTTGPRKVNLVLPGTDSNGGKPGTHSITFKKAGTWTYYCRFHSTLSPNNQPIAPGPMGGIQDANNNFGTPMMGVIEVASR